MGLLEFLQWCEDMRAEPVLAVYAGYSLHGTHINPGPELQPFVQEALDEIEYVAGAPGTVWGARRARDGHPKPFKLTYVEIGNEDWFDKSGSYDGRFAQFYDAIKARYPSLRIISTIGNDQPERARVKSRNPDLTDEHYYLSADTFLGMSPKYATKYDRGRTQIFVGEWGAYEDPQIKPWDPGARRQPPTPSMKTALGDAAFMAAMERNSDLIRMHCYAPLFVNVNPGARQWRPDLIGYNAISAYGSPSYYAFKLFSQDTGDDILSVTTTETTVQASATRQSKSGEIIIKMVNPEPAAVALNLAIKGISSIASRACAQTLTGDPEDTNSIDQPQRVFPATTFIQGRLGPDFVYPLPAHSIVVLRLKCR